MKKVKSVMLALALAVLVMPCAAMADVLYNTGAGTFGRIAIVNDGANGIVADVVPLASGVSTSAKIFAFSQFGTRYAVLTETGFGYDYDIARVYNLNSNTVGAPEIVTLTGVRGATEVLEAGNKPESSVFVIGRDSGSVVEFENVETGWPTRHDYVLTRDWKGPSLSGTVTGVDVIRHERYLYMLFGCGQNPGKLIVTDGMLSEGDLYASCDIGVDPVGIVNTSGYNAAIAYRGNGSGDGGVQLFKGVKISSLIDSVPGSLEAIASDGKEGFYFINVNGGAAKIQRWKKDSDANIYSEVSGVTLSYNASSPVQAMWDDASKVLAVLSGGDVLLLNNEGQSLRIAGAEFGGTLVSITAAEKAKETSDDDGGSSSGCSVGLTGLSGLILALGFALHRQRSR